MRILLTGGAGDLGSILVPLLIEQGEEPVVLDVRPPQRPAGEHFVAGSILDRDLLARVFSEVDAVVHIAAWHGHGRRGLRGPHRRLARHP